MSEIFTAQLTAIANVVLTVFAVVTAFYARRAFRAQSSELELQRRQFKQDQADRRRAQASRVFLWTEVRTDESVSQVQTAVTGVGPDQVVVAHIRNSSRQPVYDLEVTWHEGLALRGSVEGRGVLMPDAQVNVRRQLSPQVPSPAERHLVRTTVRFRDAAGVRWEVDQDGKLAEVPNS